MLHLVVPGLIAFGLVLLVASTAAIRYRIFDGCVKITWLLFTLRRIPLDDIKYVSTKPVWYAEKWYNTAVLRHRRLTIYRKDGLSRPISISPRNPFVFKAELDQAMARLSPGKIKVVANVYSGSSLGSLNGMTR